MARTRKDSKTSAVSPACDAADAKGRAKEQVQEVRNQVANVILDGSVEMAKRVVQSVIDDGQITALKYLWETAGLFPSGGEGEDGDSDVLAKFLLEKMGLTPDLPEDDAEDGA